jgi:chromosomal replication initiator protein
VAHAALSRAKIDIEQAKAALEYLVTRRESITIEMVIEVVADFYNLSLEEITGSGRSKRLAAPRQVAMYLAREETKASLPQVGEALGGRDHTTIMYGYEKIAKLVEQDEKIRRDIMQIRETLYQSLPAG